jgi:NAD(P)-dependent dehydrogenase (short-subunit alcohol dehydrogenase family)
MAKPLAGRTILITGASTGLGAATAVRLAASGARVYGTSRRAHALPPSGNVRMLAMDVRDEASIASGIEAIINESGRLDVLVNNAGFGIAGAVEDTLPSDMLRQLETNLLGPLRVCQAVLPIMRAQKAGRIIQISSLAAHIGIPFQGAYSASKAALSGMSEALSIEVKPFGIDVVMIEPGDTKSNFTAAREWTARSRASDVYRARADHAIAIMAHSEQHGPEADKVARLVERVIRAKTPRLRYQSTTSIEALALFLKRALSDRRFESFVASVYEPRRAS